MEFVMKVLICFGLFLVIWLQTEADFAIHEGRKKSWHLYKGLSLLWLGVIPIMLWLFQEGEVILMDYINILITYVVWRWFLYDIIMNEHLDQPIDYIGKTSYYERLWHRLLPKQNPMGYLWIRFVAFCAWTLVWFVRWIPGEYFKPVNVW